MQRRATSSERSGKHPLLVSLHVVESSHISREEWLQMPSSPPQHLWTLEGPRNLGSEHPQWVGQAGLTHCSQRSRAQSRLPQVPHPLGRPRAQSRLPAGSSPSSQLRAQCRLSTGSPTAASGRHSVGCPQVPHPPASRGAQYRITTGSSPSSQPWE